MKPQGELASANADPSQGCMVLGAKYKKATPFWGGFQAIVNKS